jgi:glycosyltransferase involved in cell wall biosynthesis
MLYVVIPAYNAHKTILKTVLSILAQTYAAKTKIVIVDDVSPDGDYSNIVQAFTGLVSIQQVRLEKNGGPAVARQKGLDMALADKDAKYIAYIDADDIYTDNLFFNEIVRYMEDNPTCVMTSATFLEQVVRDIGDKKQIDMIPHIEDMVWVFGKIYRLDFLRKHNIGFSELRSNEDLEYNTRIKLLLGQSWYENGVKIEPSELVKKEYIFFLKDKAVYLWQFNEKSITRIEDSNGKPFEYSFHTGLIGATQAKQRALRLPNANQDFKSKEIMAVVFENYNQFNSIIKERPEYLEKKTPELFKVWREFWLEFGKTEFAKYNENDLGIMFNSRSNTHTRHIIPKLTFHQFRAMLESGEYKWNW